MSQTRLDTHAGLAPDSLGRGSVAGAARRVAGWASVVWVGAMTVEFVLGLVAAWLWVAGEPDVVFVSMPGIGAGQAVVAAMVAVWVGAQTALVVGRHKGAR